VGPHSMIGSRAILGCDSTPTECSTNDILGQNSGVLSLFDASASQRTFVKISHVPVKSKEWSIRSSHLCD